MITTATADVNICTGDSALIFGNYQTTAGIYYDSLNTMLGCDSIVETTLVVNPTYSINDNPLAICNGDSVLLFGNYETAAGIYYDSLTTINGCDSIHSTTLTVDPVYASTDTITITQGDSVIVGGVWQTTAGIYYDTLIATNGCDSVVATTLIVTVGIDEHISSNAITIYPNPTTGKFQIQNLPAGQAGSNTQVERVEVYDLFGRKVLESKEREIDMRGFPKGIYFVRVDDTVQKVIIL